MLVLEQNTVVNPARTVVKLTTNKYNDSGGLYVKKSLKFLKRKSIGEPFVSEDCSMIGAELVIDSIINLFKVDDGIYSLVICNEKRDWESGHIEEYDYKLVEFKE